MRAARLLQILLILQNRGRQTSVQLAQELEVAPRTILRDVDAMTEAGLPIIVHQGQFGGIELGFNYRTRLTGLSRDEAAALGLILSAYTPMISALNLDDAAKRARAKLVESLPDKSRIETQSVMGKFTVNRQTDVDDPRIRAMAMSVRAGVIVRIRFATPREQLIHPVELVLSDSDWAVRDDLSAAEIPVGDWGRMNVSASRFARQGRSE